MTEAELRKVVRDEYVAPDSRITMKQLAKKYGIPYRKLQIWKKEDDWDSLLKRKRRGTYYGNQTSVKDGAYSTIKIEDLPEEDQKIVRSIPTNCRAVIEDEIRVLKYRERRILEKMSLYEEMMDEEDPIQKYVSTETETHSESPSISVNKETPYIRWLRLNEALDRVHGKIIKLTSALLAMEESEKKRELEKERHAIQKMKVLGSYDVDLDEDEL